MLFRTDPSSPVPLGEQIASSVRAALAEGSLTPGERLPAARALADSLDVNVHTVLRGYQRLRDEGLIELRRGRGAVVVEMEGARFRAGLLARAAELAAEARRLGVSEEELLTLVRQSFALGPAPASGG
ncbi:MULTISPECIES: GntR family transcriptional regulator [Streptomyces]|uniref:GntR family transcriptional regulator n=2 Tax=Streptomyces TaxID=1883 RepID=A0ABU2R686_9ACTN|nr:MULTISPECIES: GntR family transcriptional regulator [unclassified Streptomyces]ASY32821.1 GntR family transcriptional regulator [Streptomyces sp. CLI2509]MDT0411858.1 GntR family transcriptional regulator [Streptomyces sp. DSM 41979]MYQ57202.1 GntR family transcriptional regulator [Streptomyces sp. SID4926]MYX23003.1 GntR family transcriptional regulator [Streptomyces sp. SID8380]SCD50403.1 DNA-binding transcriptional regulator YhcF, GntR family [Streptomyces sp. TverLS-915]